MGMAHWSSSCSRGADAGATDHAGGTALMRACSQGQLRAAELRPDELRVDNSAPAPLLQCWRTEESHG